MQNAAALVETWLLQRRDAAVVRVIGAEGLGPRPSGDLLLVDISGRTAGNLLGGAAHLEAIAAARELLGGGGTHSVIEVTIDDGDASAAGLTCGGRSRLLVQRLDVIPPQLWDALASRRAVALVTALDASIAGPLVVHADGTLAGSLGGSGLDTLAQAEAEALLTHVGPSLARIPVGSVALVVEAWNPAPRLLIVGSSDLATALDRQADLLGWAATTVVGGDPAVDHVEGLGPGDVVVVLDHDPFVATPVLAAALRRRVGYVGALGSRRTQQTRREHLRAVGLEDREIARLHGPTGLDIGSRTPSETAVSIVAEVIAERSSRSGVPLTRTSGPISG